MNDVSMPDYHPGDVLKTLLKQQSLSIRQFSRLCGLDAAVVSRIINGKQQPKLKHLQVFAQCLKIPVNKLLNDADYTAAIREQTMTDSLIILLQQLSVDFCLNIPDFSQRQIEQELDKYEQFGHTAEGRQTIYDNFQVKLDQLNAAGPFIEQLQSMYNRYCDRNTPDSQRTIIASALLYFICATDIIPDFLFPIGYLDDVIAIALVLERLAQLNSQSCPVVDY